MKDSYRKGKVISNEEVSPNIYIMEVEGSYEGSPGQFYMLRGWNTGAPFLSRPISISDLKEDRIIFIYEEVGLGTGLMAGLRPGDYISLLGPLGKGFDLDLKGKIALVSGGIGIAPLLYLVKEINGYVDLYSGFRDEIYYLEQFGPYINEISISTEDGSRGHKGYITEILDGEEYDHIITCGPIPMMKEVLKVIGDDRKVTLSMEARMACGIGACVGCTIETKSGKKRVCKDGPIFKGEEVMLDA